MTAPLLRRLLIGLIMMVVGHIAMEADAMLLWKKSFLVLNGRRRYKMMADSSGEFLGWCVGGVGEQMEAS